MGRDHTPPLHAEALPDPPERLSADAAKLWREIVESLPADWFSEGNLDLLEAYCVSIMVLRMANARTQQALEKIADPKAEAWEEMTVLERYRAIAQRESAAIQQLATKMRLTQQARISAEKGAPPKPKGGHPWESK
jgi:phage terminase small subunit